MNRHQLNVHTFHRDGEVPPTDPEAWIMWQYEHYLLTDKDAILALAKHRRYRAMFRDQPDTELISAEDIQTFEEAMLPEESFADRKARRAQALDDLAQALQDMDNVEDLDAERVIDEP